MTGVRAREQCTAEEKTELYWEDCLKANVQQITPMKLKGVQKH